VQERQTGGNAVLAESRRVLKEGTSARIAYLPAFGQQLHSIFSRPAHVRVDTISFEMNVGNSAFIEVLDSARVGRFACEALQLHRREQL